MALPTLRPRLPLAGVALAAMVGIALGDWWETWLSIDLILVLALACAVFVRPRTWLCWLFVAAAFFTLHTSQDHGCSARRIAANFAEAPRVVHATGVVWEEPKTPQKWSRFTTCHFLLRLNELQWDDKHFATHALTRVRWSGPVPEYGDRVEVTGSFQDLAAPRNPGEFDYASYERRHDIYSQVTTRYASDCRITGHDGGSALQRFALKSRQWISGTLEQGISDSPEVAEIIKSLVLGIQNDTPEDLKALYQRTGTVHLFAVSGLTVGMVVGIFWFILKSLQIRRGYAVVVIIAALVLYAIVTGLRTSCLRATIMAIAFLLGYLFDRRPLTYNSLSAAALAVLAWDTDQLFSAGFQFSFVVVFIVIVFTGKLQNWLIPKGLPDPFLPRALWTLPQRAWSWLWRHFAQFAAVSVTCFVGSIPFTAGYFHLFSISSIFANIAAVPIGFMVMALGVTSLLTSWISPSVAAVFNNANWGCAKLLLWVLHFFSGVQGGAVYVEAPRFHAKPACEFTVLDLGTGGAAHLRAGGADWLIDCGHGFEYSNVVLPYLRSRGANALQGLILTHGDAEHIGGTVPLLGDFHPGIIADSPLKDRSTTHRNILETLAERQMGRRIIERGDTIELSPEARLRVLYPPAGIQKSAADDKALVLLLEAAGVKVLFMSDSGYSTEEWLMENEKDLAANLLVKGQHAKDLSGTPDFLARVHPEAIICASPAPEKAEEFAVWCDSVRSRGVALFRQDESGAVQVTLRAGEILAEGFVNGQIFRSRAR